MATAADADDATVVDLRIMVNGLSDSVTALNEQMALLMEAPAQFWERYGSLNPEAQLSERGPAVRGAEYAHKPGQYHQVGAVALDCISEHQVKGLTARVLAVVNNYAVNTRPLCAFKTKDIGFVADSGDHLVTAGPFIGAIEQGLQVGAVTGNQYHHAALI